MSASPAVKHWGVRRGGDQVLGEAQGLGKLAASPWDAGVKRSSRWLPEGHVPGHPAM